MNQEQIDKLKLRLTAFSPTQLMILQDILDDYERQRTDRLLDMVTDFHRWEGKHLNDIAVLIDKARLKYGDEDYKQNLEAI